MTKREIAALAFTIAGIYALIEAIPMVTSLVSWFDMLRRMTAGSGSAKTGQLVLVTLAMMLPLAGLLFAAYLLIVRSGKFAARMFPEDDTGLATKASAAGLQAAALSVVGVLVVALALPRLLNAVGYLASVYARTPPPEQTPWTSWTHLLAGVVQLGLGIGLFFGGRGLANYWQRLRTVGHGHKAGGEQEPAGDL